MGGLVIDIYIEYLYRVVTRMIKRLESSAWPVAKATVRSSSCPRAGYGCCVAKVYYTYLVDGEHYANVNEKPFIIRNSGENYVKSFRAWNGVYRARKASRCSGLPRARWDQR